MVKKVCVVAPSLQMGGLERSLSILANYLDSVGLEVHFVTIFPFERFFVLNETITIHDATGIFSRKEKSRINNFIYYFKNLNPLNGKIIKRVTKINPDIVVSYGEWIPHLIMLGLKNRFPFVYSNRSNPNIRFSRVLEIIRWLAYRITPPNGIIAQTSYAMARKERIFKDRLPLIEIIPNPVNSIQDVNLDKDDWIVSVGRLHKEKGFLRLIDAFSEIENNNWKLVLVGDGIDKVEIVQFIKEKGLEERVIIMGKVKNVIEILLKSRIFALASHKEGFPNALLEACSCGLPVISFDIVAGPSDIIENGINGILLDDGDTVGLTQSLNKLIEDNLLRERLGQNAKESMSRYDIKLIGEKIHTFLNNVHRESSTTK